MPSCSGGVAVAFQRAHAAKSLAGVSVVTISTGHENGQLSDPRLRKLLERGGRLNHPAKNGAHRGVHRGSWLSGGTKQARDGVRLLNFPPWLRRNRTSTVSATN